ncbi:MAG: hypothetical protein A4E65_03027 [Syntrophorhabdus sp. PtaU1.Bin153]|nr:MAG: hypothetical protein A4E65_03027 [Syntrophorhabdus sp. PtaU1.Bin153]
MGYFLEGERMDNIKSIEQIGKKARGRAERIKHLRGERVTQREAILGHCYDCMGGYTDGARDCEIETCSLYPFHPYRKSVTGHIAGIDSNLPAGVAQTV